MKCKKNQKYTIIIAMMLALFMLMGCASTKTEDSKGEVPTTVQVENVEVEKETEVQEVESTEEVVEPTESLEEWLNGIEEEFCMAVWNESIGKKDIIKNAQTYELQDGDRLFFHTPSMLIKSKLIATYHFSFDKRPYEHYTEIVSFKNKYEGENSIVIDIECKGGEQCHFECILIGDGSLGEEVVGGETTVAEGPVLSIKNGWDKELNYEEPTIVVWNDRVGLKGEIENNEKYQLQEGDNIVIFTTEKYCINTMEPHEFGTTSPLGTFRMLDFYYKNVTEETKFVIYFREQETFEEVTCEFTLLPIQE